MDFRGNVRPEKVAWIYAEHFVDRWLRQQWAWQETDFYWTVRSGIWLLCSVMTRAAWSSPVVTVFLTQLFPTIKSGRICDSRAGGREIESPGFITA